MCPLSDGLMALLLSIETFIKDFQFNWITSESKSSNSFTSWSDAFPFINICEYSTTDNANIIISNSFSIPQIGPVQLNANHFLNHQFLSSNSLFKIVKKEYLKGFLSTDFIVPISTFPTVPLKLQINLESDGILFEVTRKTAGDAGGSMICSDVDNTTNTINTNTYSGLMFLDISEKSLYFIEGG